MKRVHQAAIALLIGGLPGAALAQFGGPPPEAFTACQGKGVGDACSHPTPQGHNVTGQCQTMGSRMQCMPSFGPGGPGGSGGPGQMGGQGMGPQGMGPQGMGPQGMGQRGQGQMGMGQMGGGPQGQAGQSGRQDGLDDSANPLSPMRGWAYSFANQPVPVERGTPQVFTLPFGQTHWYEAVYVPQGGVNWLQAKKLAEEAGGYLVTFHSRAENDFVFNLIKDDKFWFKWDQTHHYVMSGPFLGAYQPYGSPEPSGNWKWVSGEPWTYTNWAQDGQSGDRDPRPSTQPNDSQGSSNIAAFGEVNDPVPTWGDFPYRFSSYRDTHEGKAYGFVIEYDDAPRR